MGGSNPRSVDRTPKEIRRRQHAVVTGVNEVYDLGIPSGIPNKETQFMGEC